MEICAMSLDCKRQCYYRAMLPNLIYSSAYFFKKIFYYILCVWCVCVYVYTMYMQCPQKPELGSPSNWGYRQLWVSKWVLGIEPGFFLTAESSLQGSKFHMILIKNHNKKPWSYWLTDPKINMGRKSQLS